MGEVRSGKSQGQPRITYVDIADAEPPRPCPPLAAIRDAYRGPESGPSILLFGDSTTLLVSNSDLDRRPLLELVSEQIGSSAILVIAHIAYHAAAQDALLRALATMPRRPDVVVLPVNLRQFSPQWLDNPNFQFEGLIEACNSYIQDRTTVRPVPPFTRGALTTRADDPAAWEQFLATPVDYNGRPERTVGDFVAAIEDRHDDVEGRRDRLAMVFAFHFLFKLDKSSVRWRALSSAIRTATSRGCDVVALLTPVNHEAAGELLGPVAVKAIDSTVSEILRSCNDAATGQPGRLHLLDLSRSLAAEEFFHPEDPTEHFNERGRQAVATAIATEVRTALDGQRSRRP